MPTVTKCSKWVVVLNLVLIVYSANGQEDTVSRKPFERYWTKPRIIPKIGFGAQETPLIEAGIQWHQIYVHPLTLASAGPYFTVDWLIKKEDLVEDPIIGPKLGYEVTAGLFGLAADVTYYTDFTRESVVLTPKAGISILGFADLFYGYNIQLSDDIFKSVSRNRFSLVFNINRDYFNLRAANKKPEKD
jgi:hypothetical protein